MLSVLFKDSEIEKTIKIRIIKMMVTFVMDKSKTPTLSGIRGITWNCSNGLINKFEILINIIKFYYIQKQIFLILKFLNVFIYSIKHYFYMLGANPTKKIKVIF